jgi:uncharacterized protein YjbJ (UPF0337 family)
MQDKINGEKDEVEGKGKEVVGKLGGDKSMEAEGKLQQGKGEVEEKIGDAKADRG